MCRFPHLLQTIGMRDEIEDGARPLLRLEGNLIGGDPGFVDAKAGNFRLRDDSPALKAGFRPIPFEEIGLHPEGGARK